MTTAELKAKIEALEGKLAVANKPRALSLKISAKGGLSLYGLQRFPVTLYKEQWLRVVEQAGAIKAFIAENDALLATKNG